MLTSSSEFNHFAIFDVCAINRKTNDGSDGMPALMSGCTGIDMQATNLFIVHDLENMRMSADEQSGF